MNVTERHINNLESLGYFKYTDSEYKNALKKQLFDSIDNHRTLDTVYDETDLKMLPHCYRLYLADQEDISESLEGILERMKRSFDKFEIPLNWTNVKFDPDENYGDYWLLELNNKKYKLRNYGDNKWMLISRDFFELINMQLEMYGAKERIYILATNNDGEAIFLDDKLFNYIDTQINLVEIWKPHEPKIWFDKFSNRR